LPHLGARETAETRYWLGARIRPSNPNEFYSVAHRRCECRVDARSPHYSGSSRRFVRSRCGVAPMLHTAIYRGRWGRQNSVRDLLWRRRDRRLGQNRWTHSRRTVWRPVEGCATEPCRNT